MSKNNVGHVIWFTGLSGSGKSTIAEALKNQLDINGASTIIIDGDVIRSSLNKNLDFSRSGINKNNKIIAELAKEEAQKIEFVLVPIISPYKSDREMVRKIIGSKYIELFISTPLEECIKRDTKGLYKKAMNGEMTGLIGFHKEAPYEAPESADIMLNTTGKNIHDCIQDIVECISQLNISCTS